jgi:hypothetical protein
MPLNTVQHYLKGVLDNVALPLDLGTLEAFIQPPNPNLDNAAGVYIWGSRGDEQRMTVPRAKPGDLSTGGEKGLTHSVDAWIIWLGPAVHPLQDVLFPAVVDTIMAVLRNTPILDGTQYCPDPVTGQLSQLLNVGERMSWEYAPVRAVADQRFLRYDARLTIEIEEIIQA